MQVAFGPDGSPSKALLGFCKKNGVQADSVVTEADAKGTQYVWVVVKQPGRATGEVCDESNSVFYNVLLLLLLSTLCVLLVLEFVPVPIMMCSSACLVANPVEAEYDRSYNLLQAHMCAFPGGSSFIHICKSLQ